MIRVPRIWIGLIPVALAIAACVPIAQTPEGADEPAVAQVPMEVDSPLVGVPEPEVTAVVGHALFPERRDFSESLLRQLRLPPGFQINVFAEGLENPRMIEVVGDGSVYVTRPGQNDVIRLRDTDSDGRSDEQQTVVSGIDRVHGIALDEGRMYLANVNNVYVADRQPDGSVGAPRPIIENLPDGGQHPNRTLEIGPDGMLYITVGSVSNAYGGENDPELATMLRARLDGSERTIFASSLRNTLGFGWHPTTGELWGMDHGIDWLGDDVQPEELNRIVQGGITDGRTATETGTRTRPRSRPRGTKPCKRTAPPRCRWCWDTRRTPLRSGWNFTPAPSSQPSTRAMHLSRCAAPGTAIPPRATKWFASGSRTGSRWKWNHS